MEELIKFIIKLISASALVLLTKYISFEIIVIVLLININIDLLLKGDYK